MRSDHLARLIADNAERYPTRPAMRSERDGVWSSVSYPELGRQVRTMARSLVDAGVQVGDRVGIFSPNRPEWTVADFAILSVGAVSVPIYATSTARQAQLIIDDADVSVLFVGGQDQYDKVVGPASGTSPVRDVVAFDEETVLTTARSVHARSFTAAGADTALDEEVEGRLSSVSTDDVATLIYTSGTTGDPKGAVLTHANFFHQFRALDERFGIGPGDTSLCFLPLSHAYERAWSCYVLASGAENCYLADPSRVVEVMAEVRPTLMVSVPRLYEKVHAGITDRAEQGSRTRARVFRWALGVGSRYQHRRAGGEPVSALLGSQHALADRLVLSKIRDVVGGDKKVLSAGGAPLSEDIEEFFFAAGLFVCQGYGLTETTAMVTCNYPGEFRFGTVGTPVLGTEVRIADGGEIQVRGGSVMKGYHGHPEATAEAFDDGWFKTGDVGTIDAAGFVTVTDRIKDIIITSQGKNVAPQHIEGVLGSDPYVEQVVVIGDRRNYLSALITPAFPVLERYAVEHGLGFSSRSDLVALPEVRALYERRIAEASTELARYEQVKRFTLMAKEFTQEEGQLTPTQKLKRQVVEQEFADVIDAMYDAPRAPG